MTTRVELVYEFTKAALAAVATYANVSNPEAIAESALSIGTATAALFIEHYGDEIHWDTPDTEAPPEG